MKDTAYLILNKNGVVALRKTHPNLSGGEAAVRLQVEIPDAVFRKFVPEATLSIGEEHVIHPEIAVAVLPPGGERPDGE